MIPGLLVTAGPKKGIYLKIPEGKPFWIGRKEDADFVTKNDPNISLKHGYFFREGSNFEYFEESSNGTQLNGYEINHTKINLKIADILRIGENHFQVINFGPLEEKTVEFDIKANFQAFEKSKDSTLNPSSLRELGPYLNIEIIGFGATGKVYKSLDKELKKLVALKVFSPVGLMEDSFFERYTREVELLKKLSHPNIIQLYNYGSTQILDETIHYIAMEYFQGVTLKDFLHAQKILSWKEAFHILKQCLFALNYIHQQKIIHRDLKPSNLLYHPTLRKVKIIDLGLGKCLTPKERDTIFTTLPNSTLGTPNFMPIEQWNDAKKVDERADIYSLGATIYFLLTGHLPYEDCYELSEIHEALVLRKLIPLEELSPSNLPKDFVKIIKTMMATEAIKRFPNTEKAIQKLQKIEKKLALN